MSVSPASSAPKKELGFVEFVCIVALMMALNALAIDAMLPALPHIAEDLGLVNDNDRQWVVTAYLLGFGGAQLIYGPLADRFGRKPVLLVGVGIYVVFSLLATMAPTFDMLILARIGQGLGSACTRVLAVSIVRDRYEGRTMARVMSFSFLVFCPFHSGMRFLMNYATKGDALALKTRRAMREHNKNTRHHQASGGSLLQRTHIGDELGLSRCDCSPQGIWVSFPGSAPFAPFCLCRPDLDHGSINLCWV